MTTDKTLQILKTKNFNYKNMFPTKFLFMTDEEVIAKVKKDMNNKVLKICFFGPSGSGKSTIDEMASIILWQKNYTVHTIGVADPLHDIQEFAYTAFNLPRGNQDGKLLQFLAEHFSQNLCSRFVCKMRKYEMENDRFSLAIVNFDCRNNAHETLKNEGFIFVKVDTNPYLRLSRLQERHDITSADLSNEVEQTDQIVADYSIDNNGSLEDLKNNVENLLNRIATSLPKE